MSLFSPPSQSLSKFPLLLPKPPLQKTLKHIPKALSSWNEYEEAVKQKDLARALRLLKSIETQNQELNSAQNAELNKGLFSNGVSELGMFDGFERDWEVLDTCLNADDMRLVGSAYGFLQSRGFLPSFGKFSNIGNYVFLFVYSV